MILLLDNHDSYTFNLYQLIAEVAGQSPLVVRAEHAEGESLPQRVSAGEFSHVVISPGPGTPEDPQDFDAAREVIETASDIPVLGICLGHQGLALINGSAIHRAPEPKHGFISTIHHTGTELFATIPQDFKVVRYHSLCVDDIDTTRVQPQAWSEDGVVMALKVLGQPHWGVQFHPESILTEHGRTLVENFLGQKPTTAIPKESAPVVPGPKSVPEKWKLEHRAITMAIDCEATFARLKAHAQDAFWLDSATADLGADTESGRYSILGTNAGSKAASIRYDISTGMVQVARGDETFSAETDILSYLRELLAESVATHGLPALPFLGGYVGFLGFECKALTVGPGLHSAVTPDAYWVFPQAFVVFDHRQAIAHLCVVYDAIEGPTAETAQLMEWLEESLEDTPLPSSTKLAAHTASELDGQWRLSADEYVERIGEVDKALRRGDSYEVCLTDTYETSAAVDGWDLYRQLRRNNPAPYAAYLKLGAFGDELEILSSSPERFLKVEQDGTVSSKPIKGTIARAEDPDEDRRRAYYLQTDPKTRAENLMIVDLLRNDLGRVCEVGSVEVPVLMGVESFRTVHQLVSTVMGKLRADADLIDLLEATFPGGSMTGAPKERTLSIIDALEAGPRGVYSGTIGYMGLDGTADLNIVIRTIVKAGDNLSVGAGGAIVLDSVAAEENVEKELKAAALLKSIAQVRGANSSSNEAIL
ncbi:aminodeoxychorismate synthase component I [Corynebacterium casei]|uniref:aminodeoxychorismate synthase component I n=2 Tax=Corynebacterium casei TaxID=160386 RepID=UPI003FD43F00